MDKLRRELERAIFAANFTDTRDDSTKRSYDPEMLYVECKQCGRPILWEPGRTTSLLLQHHISPASVDESCLILSDGCRECHPEMDGFQLSIVRLSDLPLPALLLMQNPVGNA